MAYAVHINFNAPLGDEAALAALFSEDTDNEGIQGNIAIPVKNGLMDGADRRRNTTRGAIAGGDNDRRTRPLGSTLSSTVGLLAVPADTTNEGTNGPLFDPIHSTWREGR